MTTADGGTTSASISLSIAREWPAVMFMGVMTIALGLAVVIWPTATLTVISVLLGIQLLLIGIYRLITAFSSDTLSPGLVGFFGLLSMIAGVIVLRHPFETVEVLATVLGVVWIVGGTIELISSIADSSLTSRGSVAISGLLAITAGVVVVAWPAPTVTVIAWIAGVFFIIVGMLSVVDAFSLRRLAS
ncbi:MAG: HdeD family acid-resistance protein [Acidimicrobiales bacterium]